MQEKGFWEKLFARLRVDPNPPSDAGDKLKVVYEEYLQGYEQHFYFAR